jgi:hypothetical protein
LRILCCLPDLFKRSLTVAKESGSTPFDPKMLLSVVRDGTFKEYRKKQTVFAQGAAADALFISTKAESN